MFWKYALKCVKPTLPQQHFLQKGKYFLSGSFSIYFPIQILHKIYNPCVLYQTANQEA